MCVHACAAGGKVRTAQGAARALGAVNTDAAERSVDASAVSARGKAALWPAQGKGPVWWECMCARIERANVFFGHVCPCLKLQGEASTARTLFGA